MNLYEKNGNILYILKVLQKYSDEDHKMSKWEIKDKINEIYHVDIDERTIRRNIDLLRYKKELCYDIENEGTNKTKYWIERDPETDFEPGEIRAIIDAISYSSYISQKDTDSIISKCKQLQNIYENRKISDYRIYRAKTKTLNREVIKNIEDITNAISNYNKISFDYATLDIDESNKIVESIEKKTKISPQAIFYDDENYYLMCIDENDIRKKNKYVRYKYKLDKIKNLKILEKETARRLSNKEIEKNIDALLHDFHNTGIITAKASYRIIDDVYSKFGNKIKIQKYTGHNKYGDGYFIFKVKTDWYNFLNWMFRYIDYVTIIEPKNPLLQSKIFDISKSFGLPDYVKLPNGNIQLDMKNNYDKYEFVEVPKITYEKISGKEMTKRIEEKYNLAKNRKR